MYPLGVGGIRDIVPGMSTEAANAGRLRARALFRRWPTVAGLAFAAGYVFRITTGLEPAPILVAALVIYLGTAALGRPGAAWPLFFAAAAVIVLTRAALPGVQPSWVLFALGVPLLGYGLARRAFRPLWGLPLQTLLFAVVGGLAAIGPLLGAETGGLLIAAGLLAHAALDVHLLRTGRLVPRSMAEFCVVLDTALAVAITAAVAPN